MLEGRIHFPALVLREKMNESEQKISTCEST